VLFELRLGMCLESCLSGGPRGLVHYCEWPRSLVHYLGWSRRHGENGNVRFRILLSILVIQASVSLETNPKIHANQASGPLKQLQTESLNQ